MNWRQAFEIEPPQWTFATWEHADTIWEGLKTQLRGELKTIVYWAVCGLDHCPRSWHVEETPLTEEDAEMDFEETLPIAIEHLRTMEQDPSIQAKRVGQQ